MFVLATLILSVLQIRLCVAQLKVPKEPNVLTPPYFNIATGKRIQSTATCGEGRPQIFCKLTGGPNEYGFSENLYRGQFCDVCDANDPARSHPIKYAIDGTEKWWQSPPLSEGSQFNEINITIHLGQVFHVAYVILKFANSPRAGTWVLERSSDHGETFQPWQYFANSDSDCHNLFGIDAFEEITSDNSVICTSEYSDVVPLERGEVIVSMINRRPGAKNFSHSPILQEWSKATDIRLRLLRTKTLLGHLMAVQRQDPTVTRRYFYSVKDISVGGRCVCNGHADTCVPDPLDRYKLKCECRHNTCGDSCEYCCPGFVQKAWRAAIPESANECEPCNCFGHSTECIFDEQVAIKRQSIDLSGNYDGGGVCQNCAHNTAGVNCEKCIDGFYRLANANPSDPNGCRPCNCDSAFTVGTCEPLTGRCYCKPKYAGDRCDTCAPGYHKFPDCEPCPCYFNGTRDGVCVPLEEVCPCKYNYAGRFCSSCAPGFYNFPECAPCECSGQGAVSAICDVHNGQCECEQGFGGLSCSKCSPGYYNYPICQACSCFSAFTTSEICNPIDGQCFCADLVTGPSCNLCKPGYYDFPRCRECECTAPGSAYSLCDPLSGKCQCKPNYRGLKCDECASEYYNYPNCVACNCNSLGSQRTTCDPVTGQCSCFENIESRKCDQCTPEYFNFPSCEDCKCNPSGITSFEPGVCLAFTVGQCDCKENVVGVYCDECAPLTYNLTLGCIDCNCLLQGTLDGVAACDMEEGDCWCKPYTCEQRCSQCEDGFFNLEEKSYFGCSGCQCNAGGSLGLECDSVDGQCLCRVGVTGRQCDIVAHGFYYPTLLQHKYEVEEGRTTDNEILRFGFDEERFPSYSLRGYGEFSVVQSVIVIRISVETYGLYRIQYSYANPTSVRTANITLDPVFASGSLQKLRVEFEQTDLPTLLSGDVVVLSRGEWDVIIEADPGLLIDYIALLPSNYYEPSIFQARVSEPCHPTFSSTENECLMYEHLPLEGFPSSVVTSQTDRAQQDSPSTAHPNMLFLDGNSVNEVYKSVRVSLNGVSKAGKYVLVMSYASIQDRMQQIKAFVTDEAGHVYPDVTFNIYSCLYSFLCRQVALSKFNDVEVFDMLVPNIIVELSSSYGQTVYISKIFAIPLEQWTMEYVEPKRKCIAKKGPEFNGCIASSYPLPSQVSKIDVDNINEDDEEGEYIGGALVLRQNRNPFVIDMNLKPGRYVFLLHYLNPSHPSFSPDVVIANGYIHDGSANITYCPSFDGCRALVVTNDGASVLDITSPSQTMTISVPPGMEFSLDYILAVPEESYNAALLGVLPLDQSRKYFDECYRYAVEGIANDEELSKFCQDAIFALTTDFNDGALPCECSGEGALKGRESDCEEYGGQCPCKTNVIGRQCDRCKIGFYGFPDCLPCNCSGALCDEINGNCICPPNTIQPDCNQCQPFTHSFHPLAGCVPCNCHPDGVENADDLGCSQENGQCRCKMNIEGIRCDKCSKGFFGFPDCRACVCDASGITEDGCDEKNGQCNCKENVEGQRCDRCKPGTFHLNEDNPLGCTACFCFGVSTDCTATQYPLKEIVDMDGWRLLNMEIDQPKIVRNGDTIYVDVIENGGAKDQAVLYWAAPKPYLERKIGSYGGELRFKTKAQIDGGGRGDSTSSEASGALTVFSPTVVLEEGKGLVIAWTNRAKLNESTEQVVQLIESNFVHKDSGEPVRREDMMLVLEGLQALHIKATGYSSASTVSLSNVSLTTTNYDGVRGSDDAIPAVELCTCPPGYEGNSCEICSLGYYRDVTGPFLGFCTKCDCYGHCDSCTSSGLVDGKCQHHTAGDHCQLCEDGYIGNATSGDPDACQPCPCPYPSIDGNFATKCEYDKDYSIVCFCEEGYYGEKCDQCAQGYFGNPSVLGTVCTACDCHGNLDSNVIMEVCDPITGVCQNCIGNTGGKYCERCDNGYFGDAITAKNCTLCPCDECGTLQCDDVYGYCACKDHVIGYTCNQCEPGFWNLNSCTGCTACDCAPGALNYECEPDHGQCLCAPNVIGQKCDKCSPGHWDYSEAGCKPCNCRNNGDCNPVNGECTCPPGITGPQCDQCKLKRHVLPPGGVECESCDSCSHDLLDSIELLANNVEVVTITLGNITAGVVAAKRLEGLQNQSNYLATEIAKISDSISGTEADTEQFLKVDSAPFVTGEGSGDPSDASGETLDQNMLFKEANEEIVARVAAICGYSKQDLESANSTHDRALSLKLSSTDIEENINIFLNNSKDLLSKLSQGSNGDNEEYMRNLANAEMLITKMKERMYRNMTEIVDNEVVEADSLFSQVNTSFNIPISLLQEKWNDTSFLLTDKFEKLKEMRKGLNNASLLITEINTLNTANTQKLGSLRDDIAEMFLEWELISNALKDIQYIFKNDSLHIEVIGSDELKSHFNLLDAFIEKWNTDLDGKEVLVHQAIDYANSLSHNATSLDELVDQTRKDPRNVRVLEAANRYQDIINYVEDARTVANKADLAAVEAKADVLSNDLGAASQKALRESSTLLSSVQGYLHKGIGSLSKDLESAKGSKKGASDQQSENSEKLDDINERMSELNPDDINEKVQETEKYAKEVNRLSKKVLNLTEGLQNQLNSAPNPNIDVIGHMTSANLTMKHVQQDLQSVAELLDDVGQKANGVEKLRNSLNLEIKINRIRKTVELARSRASFVSVSMEFKKKHLQPGVYPDYTQIRIPQHSLPLANRLEIELHVNVSMEPHNSLVYLGSASPGDYVALETIDGYVQYYFKFGDINGKLVSTVLINDNKWHRILLNRTGAYTSLLVEYPNPKSCRGDASCTENNMKSIQEQSLEDNQMESNFLPNETIFIIGGYPLKPLPGDLRNDQLSGCVRGLKLNGEGIGIWNFINYNGRSPGISCSHAKEQDDGSSEWWRFRGIDSYIRITQKQVQNLGYFAEKTVTKYIGFKFMTRQNDQLVFFVGSTRDQFYALEIKNGKFVFTYNFGFEQPVSETGDFENVSTGQVFLVKLGIIPQNPLNAPPTMIILVVNNKVALQITRNSDWAAEVTGDIWFGGVHNINRVEGMSSHIENINNNFRGCIREFQLNLVRKTFQIYDAFERVGVTRGCQRNSIPPLHPGFTFKTDLSLLDVDFNDNLTDSRIYEYVSTTAISAVSSESEDFDDYFRDHSPATPGSEEGNEEA